MKRKILNVLFAFTIAILVIFVGKVQAAEWYKGQLHCHSAWVDGNTLPELAVEWYKDHGYHFMALTDHNALQLNSNKWREVAAKTEMEKTIAESLVAESKKKFGPDWVETKEDGGKTFVRLKTHAELAGKFNDEGKFLLIPGHEQNADVVSGFALHANAINITESIPFPKDFPSIAAAASAWRKASLENSAQSGLEGFWMLNHPDYRYYDIPPEVLIEASEIEFYEAYNTTAGPRKRQAKMPDAEKYWDIVNAFRLRNGNKPIYGVVTDDTHDYLNFRDYGLNPGHGWIVVRAETLDASTLFRAMKKGDFYGSTGVVLKEVHFDPATKTLTVDVDPAENVKYTIRFIGTKRGFDTKKEPFEIPADEKLPARKGFTYSDQIGATFQTVEGAAASYKMTPDDLYVRAVVTSDRLPKYKGWGKPKNETAWTQPVGW